VPDNPDHPAGNAAPAPVPSAGYSDVPLAQKLGLRAGQTVRLGNQPANWTQLVGLDMEDLNLVADAPYAFGHWFVRWQADLADGAPDWAGNLVPSGMLWVSWPKKAAKVPGDMSEDAVRSAFLPLGLVDIKVCAIDATWSGLKLVRRKGGRVP